MVLNRAQALRTHKIGPTTFDRFVKHWESLMGPLPRGADGHRRYGEALLSLFEEAAEIQPTGWDALNGALIAPLTRDAGISIKVYLDYADEGFPEERLNALFQRCTIAALKSLQARVIAADLRVGDVEDAISFLVREAAEHNQRTDMFFAVVEAHIRLGDVLRQKAHDRFSQEARQKADTGRASSAP